MFVKNRYYSCYYRIINKARVRGKPDEYFEKHHIIPRCLKGKDVEWNIVKLTFREHYIVHWLLTKFVKKKEDLRSINWALVRMVHQFHVGFVPSRWYEKAKRAAREAQLEARHTEESKLKVSLANKGKKFSLGYRHTEEWKKKMSVIHKGRKDSEEVRLKKSRSKIGKKASDETRKILSSSHMGIRQTEESKRKKSLALLGRKFSEERRANISKSQCKIYIDYIGNAMTIYEAVNAAGNIATTKLAAERLRDGWPHREAVEMPKGSRRAQCPSLLLG